MVSIPPCISILFADLHSHGFSKLFRNKSTELENIAGGEKEKCEYVIDVFSQVSSPRGAQDILAMLNGIKLLKISWIFPFSVLYPSNYKLTHGRLNVYFNTISNGYDSIWFTFFHFHHCFLDR
uniref:Uncharacterized protein n=1 Tax=Candidatus Methanogaster sp. ANME-2c ERB4 TaxID=2759911 RepID=A0A7G9Y898_9EURY|nr:hypothetical protein JAFNDAPN_00015 [Methanosarcinales archaeon ANME-2c ERB4]QNO46526.1 hypothetical protein HKKCGBCL_00002 [Methanosarcinales archaeon ANME-2c ERB4]